jgi:pimeloyl-ACP methyl ester carboxylesterase
MGAAAASLAAGTHPDRIDRMVWIDSLGPLTTPADEAPDQMRKGLGERDTLLDKSNRVFESQEHAIRIISDMYGVSDEDAAPMVKRGLRQVEDGVCFTYDLALRGESALRLTEEQLESFMTQITAPTRVIRATNGWPADEEDVRRRLSWLDNRDVCQIEGGHHVHVSDAQPIAELVDDWLGSNGPAGGDT